METRGPAVPSSALTSWCNLNHGQLSCHEQWGGEREVQAESRQGIFDEVIGVGILNRHIGHRS